MLFQAAAETPLLYLGQRTGLAASKSHAKSPRRKSWMRIIFGLVFFVR
jgi:hypothetical protein